MKLSEQHIKEVRRQRSEDIVSQHMYELFQRLPMLSGFWLRPDLEVAELSICAWPAFEDEADLHKEVMQSLVQLACKRPEAVQLIRGRTFARAVH